MNKMPTFLACGLQFERLSGYTIYARYHFKQAQRLISLSWKVALVIACMERTPFSNALYGKWQAANLLTLGENGVLKSAKGKTNIMGNISVHEFARPLDFS